MTFVVRVLHRAGQDVEEILRFIAEERGAPEELDCRGGSGGVGVSVGRQERPGDR